MEEITKEKFDAYVTVQESGVTNMFHIKNVILCADQMCEVELTKKDCLYIMGNYGKLKEEKSKKGEQKK